MEESNPPALSGAEKRKLEKHHAKQTPRLFQDNLPWSEPGFARRFTKLTDVNRKYWGSPDDDVNRLEAILSTNKAHTGIVDLCCGAGRHCLELAARGYKVTGLDVSDYAIRRARGLAASRKLKAKFILADVVKAPSPSSANLVALLCEQAVNFSPDDLHHLLLVWLGRLNDDGAMVIELPTDLPPHSEELYFMAEPLFFEAGCWIRYTQDPSPEEGTLMETFTCLPPTGGNPVSFFNSRKYYTSQEIVRLSPGRSAQVIDIPPVEHRPPLQWVVLR